MSSDSSQSSTTAENLFSKAACKSFQLFRGLSEDDTAKCLSKMKVHKFKAGDFIISKGSVGTSM
jgi:hypothetical protein